MKKIFYSLMIFSSVLLISFQVFAQSTSSSYLVTFGGINGYIVAPSALPVSAGSFNINGGFIFSNPNYLPLAIAFSFIKNWEVGVGHQFALSNTPLATPFYISTKYKFLTGKLDLALGAVFEISQNQNSLEFYAAFHSGSIFGKGMMDIVIGKTIVFGSGFTNYINLYIGTIIPLAGDVLFLMLDFSNNALGNTAGYISVSRGVFNIAILFDIIPKVLTIYIAGYDFMDSPFSTIGIGIDWRLSFAK